MRYAPGSWPPQLSSLSTRSADTKGQTAAGGGWASSAGPSCVASACRTNTLHSCSLRQRSLLCSSASQTRLRDSNWRKVEHAPLPLLPLQQRSSASSLLPQAVSCLASHHTSICLGLHRAAELGHLPPSPPPGVVPTSLHPQASSGGPPLAAPPCPSRQLPPPSLPPSLSCCHGGLLSAILWTTS